MSSICENDCDKCEVNESCGGCSLCEASICLRNCKKCFALCKRRNNACIYIRYLGGVDFTLNKNVNIELTENIPIIPDKLKKEVPISIMPVIAIHGGNFFSINGDKISKRFLDKGIQRALNVNEKTKSIIEFYVKDNTLEGFWDNRYDIYSKLKKLNIEAVIAPNFSVYEDAPRLDHLCNIKRSVIVYNELINAGINAVPDVSWFNINDLDRWIKAINESDVKIIAFSFQVVDIKLKASNIWKSYLSGFRYLCKNIKNSVQIIVAGLVSENRIKEIFKASNDHKLYILNQSAYIQSVRGMLSENRSSAVDLSREKILEENIKYYNRIYKNMQRRNKGCQKLEEVTI